MEERRIGIIIIRRQGGGRSTRIKWDVQTNSNGTSIADESRRKKGRRKPARTGGARAGGRMDAVDGAGKKMG